MNDRQVTSEDWPQPSSTNNLHDPIDPNSRFVEGDVSQYTATSTPTALSKLHDWSNSARELIDTMPLPWTQGLLYCLVVFIAIALPWAFLYKMDEIGTARGRLEFKGDTVKREADIDGSVAVLKVHVKKGDKVKAGQVIMELDAKNVREQIYQTQLKLDGANQRLNQLALMKNQAGLGTSAQQQQNQAQLLEKQSQISQAEQTFVDRQTSSNLQKAEKLSQVRQSMQKIIDTRTNYLLAQRQFKDAQNESNRYRKLYQNDAVAEVKVREIEAIAQEKKQQLLQAQANLQQSKLQLAEQQDNYQKLIQQAQSDIAQAKLRLTEQQRGAQTLTKGGNLAVLKTNQQLKEIQSQIFTLQSDINSSKAQVNFLTKQLNKYLIKADSDGTIFELPITREGAVVQPKQLIAEIAPNTNHLVFKGEIAASQSESLRSSLDDSEAPGDRKDVKLKFDEFPFESYDVVKGKLTWISPNSKITSSQENIPSYSIEVQLDRSCIKHENKCISFKSGQPATAEIIIRHRRIIDFVLDPFRKLGTGNN
jgi:HlyD family secretion protein